MDIKLDSPVSKEEGGVLAGLWRKILEENNYRPALGLLVSKYIRKHDLTQGRVANSGKKTKSSILANISASAMTFKTLVYLLFNFLHVKRIKIDITLTHQNGNVSTHTVSVDNGEYTGPDESTTETKDV